MTTRYIFFFFTLLLPLKAFTQRQVCASGVMDMQQLRLFAQPKSVHFGAPYQLTKPFQKKITPILYKEEDMPASAVFFPQWTAADLPVFCRIEHEIGKKMPVMIKFRLGSVEYVDWLEGK